MQIVLATHNKGKMSEINNLLSSSYEVLTLDHFPDIKEIPETGKTLKENAFIKARTVFELTGLPSLADDTGLEVESLGGDPGVFSARYAGEGASDKDNRDKIIDKLIDKKQECLEAFYVCVLVGLKSPNDPMPIVTQGKIYGKISINSSGEGGFGYDKIFYPDGYDCSMASLDQQIKNKVSHRAIASEKFIKLFNSSYDTFL